jgi:hypothetical protein
MKAQLPLAFCLCLGLATTNLAAQPVDLRVVEKRHVINQRDGGFEEDKGWLVLDTPARQLRFEVDLQATFTVEYSRLTAIHFENSSEASKWGWPLKDSRNYLTIHHLDRDGQAAFETFHLRGDDVAWLVDALHRETGLTIDHTLAKRSFLGIPIRAAVGDRVVVTDKMGQVVRGAITELSASALAVDGYAFDSGNVHTIKRARSRGRDVLRGLAIGAIPGAIAGAWFGYGLGGSAGAALQGAAMMGAYTGATGAARQQFEIAGQPFKIVLISSDEQTRSPTLSTR